MASMNSNLILQAGQTADVMGAFGQGNALAQRVNEQQRQNALTGFLGQNAGALMAGDQNALAGLVQHDPNMAFSLSNQHENLRIRQEETKYQRGRDQVQDTRMAKQDARADEQWRMQVEEYAAQKSQAERIAEAQQVEDAVKMGLAAPDAVSWDEIMAQAAPHLVGQFENRHALAQRYMSIAEILKGQQGPEWRSATAAEAATYGAQAGQINSRTGEFKRTPVDSGMAIDVDPATGQVSVRQGAGAGGSKPLTEGQSKDAVYATRAEGSLASLDQNADALVDRASIVADKSPLGIGRGIQSDQYQMARQAGDEFLQAILRKDTGAAITADEQSTYGVTYLPQPGDGQAVLAQKKQARRRALESLKAGMPAQAILAQERALDASGSERVNTPAPRLRFNPETGELE